MKNILDKSLKTKAEKPKRNNYFNEKTEAAVLEYIAETVHEKRNKIFIDKLEPIFRHLITGIVVRKKYSYLPDLEALTNDCLIFLMSILDKFNPERGSKAYSYITRTTINWFYHEAKKYIRRQRPFENKISFTSKVCINGSINGMVTHNEAIHNIEKSEFFIAFYKFLENLSRDCGDEKYKLLIDSVAVIFKNNDELESLQKKDINCYLMHVSGLTPKEIYHYSTKFRKEYKGFKFQWLN